MMQQKPPAATAPDFYDDEEVFSTYMRARMRSASPNTTLEKPVIWELLQDVRDARILDLGCGGGAFGLELLQAGSRHYTGLEASRRMVALAQAGLRQPNAEVHLANIEEWMYPVGRFDIAVSRLVLHYIEDLAQLFRRIYQTLVPGGRLVFSVEHPVITSCNRSRGEDGNGLRQDWIVDDYFVTGQREVLWMGKRVVKYHRTVEDYFMLLQGAGFAVTHLRESRPAPEYFTDEALLVRRSRIPLFLFMAAQRKGDLSGPRRA